MVVVYILFGCNRGTFGGNIDLDVDLFLSFSSFFSANGANIPMVQSERVQVLGKAKCLCQVSL